MDDELLKIIIEMEAEAEGIECDEAYIQRQTDLKKRPYIIEKDGKFSLSLTKDGNPIKDVWFDNIKQTTNSLTNDKYFSVESCGKVGIIDSKMNTIVECRMDLFDEYELLFSCDIEYVTIYDKYGSGKIVPEKIYIPKFILVKKSGFYGILRLDGTYITECIFDYVITRESHEAWMHEVLYDDIIAVLYVNKDKEGQKVGFMVQPPEAIYIPDWFIKPVFDDWTKNNILFEDSYLEVFYENKRGYLDENGNFTESFSHACFGMNQYWSRRYK